MLKIVVSSLVLAFCAAAAVQTVSQDAHPRDSSLEGLYAAAQRSQKAGNLNQAASDYRAFLAVALDQLANSRAQIGDYAKAGTLFDEALALSPDSAPVHRDYATTELQAGDLRRAETLARELLTETANDPKGMALAHQILGRALHRMNRDQEARKELEAAVALDGSIQNEYNLAVVCLDLDDDQCAVKIFDGLEASLGDSPGLHMRFGLAYGNSDFTPRAVTEFKKVIAEDPHYPGAHYCVAAALLAAGEDEKTLQEAETELKEELAISPNDFLTYAALGKIESSYHRYAEAEKYLKRAISLNPKNPDAYLYLGQMYFDLNRYPDAEPNLRHAIELTTDISRNHYQVQKAHFLLGRILMQEHHPDEAHAEMQIAHDFADKALSKDKKKLAGLLEDKPEGGGQANEQMDATSMTAPLPRVTDPAAAAKQRTFEKQLAPAVADGYNNLGAIAATENNYSDALKYFDRAAAWNPSSEGLDYNMGRAAFMAAKFSEAIGPLSRYLRTHPSDSGIRGALAMSQFMTRDYCGSLDALRGAGDNVTSIPQMQYIYAESLVKTGQAAAGKARLEKLETAHPEIPEVHRALGEIAAREGDRQKAIKELEAANQLNGSDADTHYDLGKEDLKSGNIADAIVELETAVRLKPDEASFHRELASAYERAFRMADAGSEHRIAERLQSAGPPATKDDAADSEKCPAR